MKIGLISDIHANVTALEAVLFELKKDCDVILCAGDMVGYYTEPNEVCQMMRNNEIICVSGNHDDYVLGTLQTSLDKRAAYKTDWTIENLSLENIEWLRSLPKERHLEFDNIKIWLRHANPWDDETYLYPDSAEIDKISLDCADYLVVGHSHHPLFKSVKGGFLVNPGSVGQPRDWNPKASFAILSTAPRQVNFYRARYDVDGLQKKLRELAWPESSISILSRERL